MEKKQKLFLGFVVMVLAAFITMAGCASTKEKKEEGAKFPSGFIGTWERIDGKFSYTLTFTSDTIRDSNQEANYWRLTKVAADNVHDGYNEYIIAKNADIGGDPIYIKLVGNILHIQDTTDITNPGNDEWSGEENDWSGEWKRK